MNMVRWVAQPRIRLRLRRSPPLSPCPCPLLLSFTLLLLLLLNVLILNNLCSTHLSFCLSHFPSPFLPQRLFPKRTPHLSKFLIYSPHYHQPHFFSLSRHPNTHHNHSPLQNPNHKSRKARLCKQTLILKTLTLADKSEIAMIWRHPTICGAVKENKTTVPSFPLKVGLF